MAASVPAGSNPECGESVRSNTASLGSERWGHASGVRSSRARDAAEEVGLGLSAGLNDPCLPGATASRRDDYGLRDLIGAQERETRRLERVPQLARDHRRVHEAGAYHVDADPPLRELRCDRADEPDDRVLRERVDRVALDAR